MPGQQMLRLTPQVMPASMRKVSNTANLPTLCFLMNPTVWNRYGL